MSKSKIRLIYNIGINDYTDKIYVNNKLIKSYETWRHMIRRCYHEKDKRYSNYGGKGVTVCEEWLYFSNFKKWFDENYRWDLDEKGIRLDLDKDLLSNENNKIYSPNTCIFIPNNINLFLSYKKINNKFGYTGVYHHTNSNVWVAQIRDFHTHKKKHLGCFKNIEDAIKSYKIARKIEAEKAKKYLKDLCYDEIIIKNIK